MVAPNPKSSFVPMENRIVASSWLNVPPFWSTMTQQQLLVHKTLDFFLLFT
jgi:hypothetical protein